MKYRVHVKLETGDEAFLNLEFEQRKPKPEPITKRFFNSTYTFIPTVNYFTDTGETPVNPPTFQDELFDWIANYEDAPWHDVVPAEIIDKDMNTREGWVVNTSISIIYSIKEM